MKHLVHLLFLFITGTAFSQQVDTLLYERFETGGTTFTLNTADAGGVSAATGYNQWLINDIYAGGNGSLTCGGFPTTFTVPPTPTQPAGITGGATSNYMHIISDAGQASGILNCSYLAANGLCGNDEFNFTAMNQDVNTVGYDSIEVSFLWLNAGGANIYGEIHYSTNSGISWNVITSPISQYKNQSSWITQTINIPAFANQNTLRFGFRFVNQVSFSASDPGFAIDEFRITAKNAAAPPVASFSSSDSLICEGGCINFQDLSSGNPTSWFWIFQGSTTSFSTQQNPSAICYPAAGSYPVTLIVESASGSDTLTTTAIAVNPLPPAVITINGDTLSAPSGYSSYQWYLNGNLISGAVNDTLISLAGGSYTVNIMDSTGCEALSLPVLTTTGLSTIADENIFIYPNPTHNFINIHSSESVSELFVMDAIGKIVVSYTGKNYKSRIDLSMLQPGIYFLQLKFPDKISVTKKIIRY